MNSNLRVTSSNAQAGRVKPRVGRLKARVQAREKFKFKRENSEFKILNFTSYKKFYFNCLANTQLNPNTKVFRNLFHNTALRKHI